MAALDRVCDNFSSCELSALAREFPGYERIFVPTRPQGKTWDGLSRALGEEKATLMLSLWGGDAFPVPVAYRWNQGIDLEALFELVMMGTPLPDLAQQNGIGISHLVRLLHREVRRRDNDILQKAFVRGDSQYQLARQTGIPYSLIRREAHRARQKLKESGQLTPFESQVNVLQT